MRKLDFRTLGYSADVDDRAYRKISQISICTLLINGGFPAYEGEGEGRDDREGEERTEGGARTLRHAHELMLIKSRPRLVI